VTWCGDGAPRERVRVTGPPLGGDVVLNVPPGRKAHHIWILGGTQASQVIVSYMSAGKTLCVAWEGVGMIDLATKGLPVDIQTTAIRLQYTAGPPRLLAMIMELA